jgi:3-methyladenine DNA glycosylase AlkD
VPTVTPTELVGTLDAQLQAAGTPARAVSERAYLKSSLEHYGASVPAIRAVAKGVRRAHPDMTHTALVELVTGLWAEPVHERRMLVVELLIVFADRLGPRDIGMIERMLRESGTWALVDSMSATVVGGLVVRHPDLADHVLDRWATDPDFWIRRSAMLALLGPLRKGGGDVERFFGFADAMLDEREFFIRKAIGWVLREMARQRPDLVFDWLAPRARRASGVTVREAVKPMSPSQRDAILTAYQA